MDDESALLAAIAAHPDEDTPRLAYADWLDEHGFPIRAEFIRVQIEIKKYDHLPSSQQQGHAALYRRQDAILTQHRRELLGPLGDEFTTAEWNHDIVFDRGFLTELTLDAQQFLNHADTIAAMKPLPDVAVYVELGWHMPASFLRDPHIELVRALHMVSHVLDLSEIAFNQNPRFDRKWSRLRTLNLEGCGIGDLALRGIAESPRYPVLTDLDLSGNEISDDGVRLLTESPLWPRLKKLVLGRNPISDIAAQTLAGAAGTSQLDYLDLRWTAIGPGGHPVLLPKYGGRVVLF
ncbi:MAG TPA: TIGR02996 domain-containing protein [Gemmataceae bacterium]|nr:TIGR02996 domain-containing protein [Gemmataceae bacterium]